MSSLEKSGKESYMFIGTYYHTLEDKGRVAVPKTFRQLLGTGSVATYGLDGCLFIFTEEGWSKLTDKLSTLPLGSKPARDFLRLLTYNATPIEFDALGRTHLPENLIALGKLKKEVVFAGALSRVELWDKQAYHTYVDSLSASEATLSETLGELGI
ncbi:MAG: division/cell wall cluster transcriptional repressor MraZ [bacterium]